MARGDGDAPADVTESSATNPTNEATPMADAPAAPTPAQAEQQAQADAPQETSTVSDPALVRPSDEAVQQARQDAQKRVDDPNAVVKREAKPEYGGESFAYLQNVRA